MCKAARVVLACWGSYGDLFPYLGLAVRLKSRGHSPVLASCPFYRPLVESEGIEFHPLRPDVDPLATATIHRIMDPARGSEFIIRDVLMPALEASCSDLAGAVRDADLLVAHPVTFAAPIVADERRLTWLSTVLAPVSFFSVSDFPALPPFSRVIRLLGRSAVTGRLAKRIVMKMTRPWTAPARDLRARRGLPPAGDPLYEGQFSSYGTLALFSRVLAAPQADWPPRTQVTGFVNYNGPVGPLPIELARFLDEGEPPIVFTLGTSAVGAAGAFYDESARAAMMLGRRAVLLVGTQVENRPKVSLPPDIAVVEYAPHALLFARAAAVVHHGGIGTTGQVLQSARPMLVVPFAHDQPDNAYRARDLGVARIVYPAEFKAARIAAELRTLMSDAGYATRAQTVARDLAHERGADTACDIMLQAIGAPAVLT